MAKPKDIRLCGAAASWQLFRPADSIWRQRFVYGCFSKWIANDPDAIWTPIRIQHLPEFELPLTGVFFRETARGLEVSFRPGQDELTDDVLLALRCGHFGGMSLGYNAIRVNKDHVDKIGRFGMILEAEVGEVSLVDRPLIPGTSIGFSTWARPSTPIRPQSIADRRRLDQFLSSISYELPKQPRPKPTPKAEEPKPAHKPTAADNVAAANLILSQVPIVGNKPHFFTKGMK